MAFTGLGFLLLVLVLVGQGRPTASRKAILTASHLPVEADTIDGALTVDRTGAGLSALNLVRTNAFALQQSEPPLAAAPSTGGPSGLRERTAITAFKQEGTSASQEKAITSARYGLRPKEQDSVSPGNRASNYVHGFNVSSNTASPRLTPESQVKADGEREVRLSGSSSGDQLEGVIEGGGAVSGNIGYPRGALTNRYMNDQRAPRCEITKLATDATGKKFIEVTAQDTGSGLAAIRVVTATTTNVAVTIPSFPVGTTNPVVVTATQIDRPKASRVELEVADLEANITHCGAVITTLELGAVKELAQTFSGISSRESFITVQNDAVGLSRVSMLVNGQNFALPSLGNHEARTIEVSSAMAGADNTITVTGYGDPGASALVIIADGHLPPSERPFLSISVSDGTATVRWMMKGTLQSAKSVTGPWSNIVRATSPFTAPAAGTTFYRVRQ